jgi:hypothetical protein
MNQPSYLAARAASERIHRSFVRHMADAAGDDIAVLPDLDTIQALIDAAFWASLRREEGYVPRISLAYLAPGQTTQALLFERPFALAPRSLTRVAPAVERPGIHLGVWPEGDEMRVWGATRNLPRLCFVIEVVAPGLLVIKHSRSEEAGKFINVAVLQGDQIKVVGQRAAAGPDCPAFLSSLFGLESEETSASVAIQLAVSMRAHGRGGALLIVPANSQAWQESMLTPITYAVAPPFAGLADLMQENPDADGHGLWQDAVLRTVDNIAGLTAVDGATVISDKYELLAFGAKIVRRKGRAQVNELIVTEPIEEAGPAIVEPSQLGGTRHFSAAQFVHDQPDAIAMVASQDGRFTVFGWSTCEGMVHAHRIETLLL